MCSLALCCFTVLQYYIRAATIHSVSFILIDLRPPHKLLHLSQLQSSLDYFVTHTVIPNVINELIVSFAVIAYTNMMSQKYNHPNKFHHTIY